MQWSSSQLLELLVVLCVADNLRYAICNYKTASALAESKGGRIRPDSMPIRSCALVLPAQGFVFFVPLMVYILVLIYYEMEQPAWMNVLALPDVMFGIRVEGTRKIAVRILACVASVALHLPANVAFEHLGDQYHPIGRREKQRVVQTGPYAWVRHPMYSLLLLQHITFFFMFWSYAPLLMLIASVVLVAIKIPIEEEAIQRDETMKQEYRAYMKKVPSKVVPYVW